MKKRNGFVSNSSSSSFICDVCGRVEGGFDASLGDFDMFECENGHVFCLHEIVHADIEIENDYDLPAHLCPICTMTEFRDRDLLCYALSELGIPSEKLEERIRERFETYDEFRDFITKSAKS